MTPKGVLIGALLAGGSLVELGCCIGLLAAPTLEDRLHFLTPASSLGAVLIASAIVTKESLDHQGIVAVVVAVFLMMFNPVISHATARAARIRRTGDWRAGPREGVRRT